MLINYKDVDVYQEDQLVLKRVNFYADEGEFIYLIGKVGSGKTSLLKTFYNELDVKSGQSDVLGYDMSKIKRKQVPTLRRQLGIIFQDFQLLTDRSVKENLDFVLKSTGWGKKKEREKRIKEVLEMVNMSEKLEKMPYELSGGEQQNICIARALLNHPKVILADEATGNLDSEAGKRTAETLYNICKSGTAVILSTHNESLIRNFPGIVYRCENYELKECTAEFGEPEERKNNIIASAAVETSPL